MSHFPANACVWAKLRSCPVPVFTHNLSFTRSHCRNAFPSFGVLPSSWGVFSSVMNSRDSLFCRLSWRQAAALVSTPTPDLAQGFGKVSPTRSRSHCCPAGYARAVLHARHGLAHGLGTVLHVCGAECFLWLPGTALK